MLNDIQVWWLGWLGKFLKFAFMLFKPRVKSSSWLNWTLSSRETASMLGYNFWIIGYTWLPNLSTYSLTVFRPWRVIMRLIEYCSIILLPESSQNHPVFHCWNQAFRSVDFLGWSPNAKSSRCRGSVKESYDHIKHTFPVAWHPGFIVVTPSFTYVSITLNNQRISSCSPTVDVGFLKLTSDSFCGNKVFGMNIQFCCPVTCAAAVLWFFDNILLNVRWYLSVSVEFRAIFRFAGVVFPRFVYADVSLETVALNTPNNVAVFATNAAAKRAPTFCPLLKFDRSPVFTVFETDCQSTQTLMHWQQHCRV
jgi:hypothetical protein